MALRPRVTTQIGDPERRPLRFDVQRKALDLRNRQFGDARRAPINVRGTEVGTGKGLGFEVGFALSADEIAAINAVPKIRRQLNRIADNAGARLLRRVQEVSRQTYETGLFYSGWRFRTDIGSDLTLRIELQNPAPYALYVHRKGTPKERTIVNTYVKPLVQAAIDELLADLTGESGVLPRALAGIILKPFARGA